MNEEHYEPLLDEAKITDIVNQFATNELKTFMLALSAECGKDPENAFHAVEKSVAIMVRSAMVYTHSMLGDDVKFKHYCYDFIGRLNRTIEVLGEPTLAVNPNKRRYFDEKMGSDGNSPA